MKFISHILASAFLLSLFVTPVVSHAQFPDLIVCNGPDCDFDDLVQLGINLINFMFVLSTFIAVAVFAFVGIKLLTSGGDEGALRDAKGMAWKVLVGYLWILSAWLIVYTIESVLLEDGYSILGAPRR